MEIIKTDISDKLLDLNSLKASQYIEVVFKEDVDNFDFLYLKNFYTSYITIRQFDASKPEENDWVPILNKYKLMDNNELDYDSEKIHLIEKKFVGET